jgi:zinc ribbon protein
MDPTAGNDVDLSGHEPLAGGIGGDRCTNCGTPLASDQRYCINCGQRRGKARFSFDSLAAASAPAKDPAPASPPPKQKVSSGVSLIAGVATLLIAIGVGFLIGHGANNKQTTQPSQAAQVIRIQGGGGGGGGGSGAKVKGHRTKASAKAAPAKAFQAPQLKLNQKQVQAVNKAASSVLGSGAAKLSTDPTVQPGQSCSGGAGCQGGKFTGNFFGQ